MNSTTVRNIAITLASTVIAAVQLHMAHRHRQRDHAWAQERAAHEQRGKESHDQQMRYASASERRAQEAHEDHMRWSRGIPTPTN